MVHALYLLATGQPDCLHRLLRDPQTLQSELLGEVAGGEMTAADIAQWRYNLCTDLLGVGAAGVEGTATGLVGRVSHLASQHDTAMPL